MTVVRVAVIPVPLYNVIPVAPYNVIPVAPIMSSQCVTLGWLCCIATYERLTIARIISNLLKILFFCNQSDQI
ncbi:hypothetical protein [Wolbachia endosymbiont (group A) of Rhinocyllus conicus]|uniref:hypothetical protein n=1 Tax=Wolbachia endosymbiont (group A) of Rhinocyllus conicus TaxID=2954053 RepID=UPI002226E6F4|nr:hypothetical protein [Wolbachia endosymbiont (group A) of Rhinocyllus conicus]